VGRIFNSGPLKSPKKKDWVSFVASFVRFDIAHTFLLPTKAGIMKIDGHEVMPFEPKY
jgi:hypothetical protein